MGNLSYHAGTEGKISQKDIRGITGHTMRKSEDRYKTHSNEMIDRDKTKYNFDWTKDGRKIEEIVTDRLENEYKGKRALRKDAVVLREIIIQASPDTYENMTLEEKNQKAIDFTEDSLNWFIDEFGEDNVIGASVHLDETNPHTHVMIMPMTEDGRMSQKDFFKGPGDLRRQHKEYRERMNEYGWDFDIENKYEGSKGVTEKEFKMNAEEITDLREKHTKKVREVANLEGGIEVLEQKRKVLRTEQLIQIDRLSYDMDIEKFARDKAYERILQDPHRLLKEREERVEKEERRQKAYRKKLEANREMLNKRHKFQEDREERFQDALSQYRDGVNWVKANKHYVKKAEEVEQQEKVRMLNNGANHQPAHKSALERLVGSPAPAPIDLEIEDTGPEL